MVFSCSQVIETAPHGRRISDTAGRGNVPEVLAYMSI